MSNPTIRVGNQIVELIGMSRVARASETDLIRDENGYTNPNLHRRVDEDNDVIASRVVDVAIRVTDSYRSVLEITHASMNGELNSGACILVDEQGNNLEIP